MDPVVSAFAVSQISALEPLAGICLAINLAYLNLKRWRYRDEIRGIARKALGDLDQKQNDNGDKIQGLSQLKGLKVLVGERSDHSKLPIFIRVFQIIFGNEWDTYLASFLSLFSTLILSVGVAHQIQIWDFLLPFSNGGWAIFSFYTLLAALAIPLSLVVIGRYLVGKSNEYAKDCADELASVYQEKILEVVLPAE